MPDVETDSLTTGSIESWQENTESELVKLKKEMIGRVVDKMKEKDENDAFLHIWEDMVVDYLLDEGDVDDKVNDLFLWIGINLFSNSADQLKDLREKIKKSNTKEELNALEKSIIENLDNPWNDNQTSSSSTSTFESAAVAGSVVPSPARYTSSSSRKSSRRRKSRTDSSQEDSYTESRIETSVDSAKVWEAKEVPLKQRMRWLFPEWTPTAEKQMKKYLTKIKVPIITSDGRKKKLTLHIHKKLANEYKAIFQEMYDKRIPVNPSKTWWYNWRKVRRWKKLSHHSYWSAVDVNWDVNGWVYWKTDRNSPYYNDQAMVNIWKKHGFYRWWDWSARSDDPMHFTYMNG